ncbi:MAG: hypothetical protein MJ168_01325 [Clostridia bacterium]|nr:hypothetical protein [Clostridia bacterium]
MANYEFGIMKITPKKNSRYDVYEPEKYDCISVHDDFIDPLLEKLSDVDCYWHTLEQPEKGLAYCGITLIPPSSMDRFAEILERNAGTEKLKNLLLKAKEEDKFVIAFGI